MLDASNIPFGLAWWVVSFEGWTATAAGILFYYEGGMRFMRSIR